MADEFIEVPFERHYTAAEIGKMLNLSRQTVSRMLENEPGVLHVGSQDRKRVRNTIRVPASTLQRLLTKWAVK